MSVETDVVGIINIVANYSIMPFWFLLIFFPTWKITTLMVRSCIVPATYGIVYITLMIIGQFRISYVFDEYPSFETNIKNSTIGLFTPQSFFVGIANVYTNCGAWVHYLGGWIVIDARRSGVPHIFVIIPLVLCFMLGPTGILIYFMIKLILLRRLTKEAPYFNEKEAPKFLPDFKNCKDEIITILQVWFGTKKFWYECLFINWFLKQKSPKLIDNIEQNESPKENEENEQVESKSEKIVKMEKESIEKENIEKKEENLDSTQNQVDGEDK